MVLPVDDSDTKSIEARDEAVSNADIICMTTNTSVPLFDGNLVKAGTHINGIGSYT